uniref:Uncharacterized protein n=1 Tax=Rangifer tarandus platyrhynchus TaxID=3082113 RepID=A0ACB0ERY7_RANTA|nr:unnamed protein product [Rangifer tarandus platyrhynchus]
MLPRGGGAEAPDWHLDMRLTGQLVLSAAALLLLAAAYRLYKSRPARALPRQGGAEAGAEGAAGGSGQPAVQEAAPRAPQWDLRRRRGSKGGAGLPGCSWENTEASRVPATGASSAAAEAGEAGKAGRKGAGAEHAGQCPDADLAAPRCGGQEAGTAVDGRPEPPHHCHPCGEPPVPTAGLPAVESGRVGGELAPWRDSGPPKHAGGGEQESPHEGQAACPQGRCDMDNSWVFTHASGVHREEAGALQAASDLGLALRQREGNSEAPRSFSSVARARVGESLIPERVEGARPRLKAKVCGYYVESTSQATSRSRLAPGSAAPVGAPAPESESDPLGTRTASEGPADDGEGGPETAASPGPVPSQSTRGFSRKESLLQIVENPDLQLQLDGFGDPDSSCPDQSALRTRPTSQDSPESSSAGSRGKPPVHSVAGTNFFRPQLGPGSAPEVHLDLGNCCEALTFAKRENLEPLKEAAYQVMSDNYLQVLRSPDIYGRLSGAERELVLQRRLRGRKHLVVAAVCPQEGSGRLCCYDDARDAWRLLARLPPEAVSRGCSICSLFNYLFLVSGCQGSGRQPSNRVFCYNPLTDIWSEVCPLNQARPHCRLVALDGQLYAVGGECLNTVERYDPRLDRWTFAPPLPNDTFALAHTAAASGGELFVTGGSLRYLLLRFSAREQRWRAGPTGGGRGRTAEMVAVRGFLYRFDLNRSLGISVYRCSASARLWYQCATYRTPYPDAFQCAVVDELVYCVGRRRTLRFLADCVSPRFVPEMLQAFPSPQGTLLPTVLTLPGPDVPQTRV